MNDDKLAKSESITLRLKKETLEKIRRNAKYDKITLNSAASQMLDHAVDWSIPAARAGWVPIPKKILMAIIENLDEDTINQVASAVGKTVPKDMLLIMKDGISISDWVEVLKDRAIAAGFSHYEEEDKDKIHIVTKHDMGMKWSLWFRAFYKSYFEELGCPVKFSITDSTIVYEIQKSNL